MMKRNSIKSAIANALSLLLFVQAVGFSFLAEGQSAESRYQPPERPSSEQSMREAEKRQKREKYQRRHSQKPQSKTGVRVENFKLNSNQSHLVDTFGSKSSVATALTKGQAHPSVDTSLW